MVGAQKVGEGLLMDMSGKIVLPNGKVAENVNEEQISDSFYIKGNKNQTPRIGQLGLGQKTGFMQGGNGRTELEFQTLRGYLTNEEMTSLWSVSNPHKKDKQSHFVYTIAVRTLC